MKSTVGHPIACKACAMKIASGGKCRCRRGAFDDWNTGCLGLLLRPRACVTLWSRHCGQFYGGVRALPSDWTSTQEETDSREN